jgi:hypothetical protein
MISRGGGGCGVEYEVLLREAWGGTRNAMIAGLGQAQDQIRLSRFLNDVDLPRNETPQRRSDAESPLKMVFPAQQEVGSNIVE